MKISFMLNHAPVCIDTPADRRVVDLLREDFGLTGTKEGCGTGECGACTIRVDDRTRLSCLMVAAQLDGRRITTIEGVARENARHPIQDAFVTAGAVQCGFCTPGMVLTAVDLLERSPSPTRAAVRDAISGNLCRCTGYVKIMDAIETAASRPNYRPNEEPSPISHGPVAARIDLLPKDPASASPTVLLPKSMDDLWRMRTAHPTARVLAGGTDLWVWVRNRRIDRTDWVSLERIAALRGISETDTGVWVGACTPLTALLESRRIQERFPVLAQAVQTLGSPHIRNMGTLGGNIMTASPAGDTLPALHVLKAVVEVQSVERTRRIPIDQFLIGPGQTALGPGEILTRVFIPTPQSITLQHFEKVGLRNAMACSIASLAAALGVSDSGKIVIARLAWGSVGPTVLGIPEVEAALIGKPLIRNTLDAVIPMVRQRLSPIDDVRASADYRRLVAGNLLLRLISVADRGANEPPGPGEKGTCRG